LRKSYSTSSIYEYARQQKGLTSPLCKFPVPHFEFPASGEEPRPGELHARRAGPAPPETVINRDPRFAARPGAGGQANSPQLRVLAAEDPDFLADLIEGKTNLFELIAILDASIRAHGQWFPATGVARWDEFAPIKTV
jgi:hypothetical protein